MGLWWYIWDMIWEYFLEYSWNISWNIDGVKMISPAWKTDRVCDGKSLFLLYCVNNIFLWQFSIAMLNF